MYAELVIRTRRNLPRDIAGILHDQWGPGTSPSQVVPATGLPDWMHWIDLVRFAQISINVMYFVLTPDPRTLRLHVESRIPTSGIRVLRALVEDETRRVRTLLARHDNSAESFTVRLYAEGSHLQTGRMLSRTARMTDELRGSSLSTLYVPLSAFLLSLLMRYDLRQALHNVGAALIALAAWGIGMTFFAKTGYQYTEDV
jgi:hypothetical protein